MRKFFWNPAAAVLLSGLVAMAARAQTFTSLATFNGSNGELPNWGALVQGTDGAFYGVTANAWGGVYKITRGGTLTVLVAFNPNDGRGADPFAGLALGADGNFYGSTHYGGPPSGLSGLIYQMTPAGGLTTLYNMASGNIGEEPWGALVQANDGNFYGTARLGGAHGYGTVFKLSPEGAATCLYNFDNTDGAGPTGALIQATNGKLYGTTYQGGPFGVGTIFEITTSGVLTMLHAFRHTDGAAPQGGLIQAGDGNFYGATFGGGTNNRGTIFRFTGGGVLTTLYSFAGPDGANPRENPIQAVDGNFYGTTNRGGDSDQGTVYQITPTGTLTTLHSFSGPDGSGPWATLVQATDGRFYGTTSGGGISPGNGVDGTIFRIDTGLPPFVRALPVYGRVGNRIRILGADLTGATGVTFNGVPATFSVISATQIVATVPAAATTGGIMVSLPAGLLFTNGAFQVMP